MSKFKNSNATNKGIFVHCENVAIFGGFQTSVKMRIAKVKKISHENIAMQTLEIHSICPIKHLFGANLARFSRCCLCA